MIKHFCDSCGTELTALNQFEPGRDACVECVREAVDKVGKKRVTPRLPLKPVEFEAMFGPFVRVERGL
jgi:hypothetical protein